MQRIYKIDVDMLIESFEKSLFKSVYVNSNLHIGIRMQQIFAELYIVNHFPEGINLLIESYKLLQTKGYYYTDEK